MLHSTTAGAEAQPTANQSVATEHPDPLKTYRLRAWSVFGTLVANEIIAEPVLRSWDDQRQGAQEIDHVISLLAEILAYEFADSAGVTIRKLGT